MYRTRFAYPSTHQWTRAASALGPLGYGPPCTVRGRAVDVTLSWPVKTFGAGTVLFLALKPRSGLYETGPRPCKVGLLISCLPGEGRGHCVIYTVYPFLPVVPMSVCPAPLPTLHRDLTPGQGWLESCFTPRPVSYTHLWSLATELRVAPERGRCWLELMLASQDVDVVACRNASGTLLAAQQGRTRGCRVWRAGRVGGSSPAGS